MRKLSAKYKIITPMFIGNGQQEADSVRPPSIKGALRFWWRALNWGRCLTASNADESAALCMLNEHEAHLFGRAAREEKNQQRGGQGVFLLKVDADAIKALSKTELDNERDYRATPGHQYLLGQGLYKNRYLRSALSMGKSFSVHLQFKPKTDDSEIHSIAEALMLFGLLGGLGSRARRGLGSIAIQHLEGSNLAVPKNCSALEYILKQLTSGLPESLPPFTALSKAKETRLDISIQGTDAWSLLGTVGREFQLHRSYGKDGKVNGQDSERRFVSDHNLADAVTKGETVSQHPQRVVFGLPHNYFFSNGSKVDVGPAHQNENGEWTSEGRGRRASPLFIHAHQFPEGQCAIIQALLPATFLPQGDHIVLEGADTSKILPNVDWKVVHGYMERFAQRQGIEL
ncbi:MAG: type III-B CRISPR module RAMP protein Cmr1 [Pseudomonadota bacterium]